MEAFKVESAGKMDFTQTVPVKLPPVILSPNGNRVLSKSGGVCAADFKLYKVISSRPILMNEFCIIYWL